MTATPSWTYRPALDGIRGVAILLVILGHTQIPGFWSGGATGVTLFFVLSGFLITGILRREQVTAGRISFRPFYYRRALRLLPALGVFLLVMLAIGVPLVSVLAGAVYVGNLVRATGGDLWPIGHLWSLAVEEQFYLVWPVVLAFVPMRPQPLVLFAVAGMVAAQLTPSPAYDFVTWTHAPSLVLGAALAIAATDGWQIPWPRAATWVGSIGLAVITVLPWARDLYGPAAIAGALLIAGSVARPALTWAPLRQAGKISYAWYLWHFPLVQLLALPREWEWLITIPVSLGLAALSWRYVERPAQRLREALAPEFRRVVARRVDVQRPAAVLEHGQHDVVADA